MAFTHLIKIYIFKNRELTISEQRIILNKNTGAKGGLIMCLGKVFIEKDQELSPFMDNITNISMENGELVFTSLMGETQSLVGQLKQIDFNRSKIIVTQN